MKLNVLVRSAQGNETTTAFEIQVEKDYCLAGRANADITLNDAYSSKHHAVFYEDDKGRLCVRDLKSLNGVYLHGRRIENAVLRMGSEIQIGSFILKILAFRPSEPNLSNSLANSQVITNRWPDHASAVPRRIAS